MFFSKMTQQQKGGHYLSYISLKKNGSVTDREESNPKPSVKWWIRPFNRMIKYEYDVLDLG